MKILAIVLAGGCGTRLHPLTAEQAKPALPFTAKYRIIDFVLSNLANSGISPIYVIAQYKPKSLIEHIRAVWFAGANDAKPAISVVLPDTERGAPQYKGTADAVYQNLHLIERHRPDLVAVFAADHIYRMDVRQMVRGHIEHNAEITIAAVPVPLAHASAFGVMAADPDGQLRAFEEKPVRPAPIPDNPFCAYASMGNYLFNAQTLVELLHENHRNGGTDFGHHILPRLQGRRRAWVYNFLGNKLPGVQPYEERGYWRDVGTLEAYDAAKRDVAGSLPRFCLENPEWPICAQTRHKRKPVATAEPKQLHQRLLAGPPPNLSVRPMVTAFAGDKHRQTRV